MPSSAHTAVPTQYVHFLPIIMRSVTPQEPVFKTTKLARMTVELKWRPIMDATSYILNMRRAIPFFSREIGDLGLADHSSSRRRRKGRRVLIRAGNVTDFSMAALKDSDATVRCQWSHILASSNISHSKLPPTFYALWLRSVDDGRVRCLTADDFMPLSSNFTTARTTVSVCKRFSSLLSVEANFTSPALSEVVFHRPNNDCNQDSGALFQIFALTCAEVEGQLECDLNHPSTSILFQADCSKKAFIIMANSDNHVQLVADGCIQNQTLQLSSMLCASEDSFSPWECVRGTDGRCVQYQSTNADLSNLSPCAHGDRFVLQPVGCLNSRCTEQVPSQDVLQFTFSHKLGQRASECAPDPSEEAKRIGNISSIGFAVLALVYIRVEVVKLVYCNQPGSDPFLILHKTLQLIQAPQFVALTASMCTIQGYASYSTYMEAALQFEWYNLRITTPLGLRQLPGISDLLLCSAEPIDLVGQARSSIGDFFVGNVLLVLLILLVVSTVHTAMLSFAPKNWHYVLQTYMPFPMPQLLVLILSSQGLLQSSVQIIGTAGASCKLAGLLTVLPLFGLFMIIAIFLWQNVPSGSSRGMSAAEAWTESAEGADSASSSQQGFVAGWSAGSSASQYGFLFTLFRQSKLGRSSRLITCIEELAIVLVLSFCVEHSCSLEAGSIVVLQLARLVCVAVLRPYQDHMMLRVQVMLLLLFVCFSSAAVMARADYNIAASVFFALSATILIAIFLAPIIGILTATIHHAATRTKLAIAGRNQSNVTGNLRVDDKRTENDIWEPGVGDTMAGDADTWAGVIQRQDDETDPDRPVLFAALPTNYASQVSTVNAQAMERPVEETSLGPEPNFFVSRRPVSASSLVSGGTIQTNETDLIIDDLVRFLSCCLQ